MSADDDPLVGREIAGGRYYVVNVLGRGGMGTVYTALQRPVDRKVALKIIHRELAGNPEIVARFTEEMRTTAAIEHPHTVRVYDFGDIDGQPFLTTEFLAGRSLREEMQRTGPFPQDRVASIAVQIAKALRAAKAHGVVHRDLKPENIMLLDLDGDADYVKVLDFGIARSLHRTTGVRTGTGALLGTPAYMSPEQCEGRPVDGRSDLYTLGLIAYELATGALPFPLTDSVPQLLIAHVSLPPPDVRGRAPHISEPLAAFIMRLLSKSPADRFTDAEAAIAALEPMVPTRRMSRAIAATEASPSAQRPVVTPAAKGTEPFVPSPPPAPARTSAPARAPASSKRGHLLTVVVGLAVAGGIGWWAYGNRTRTAPVAAGGGSGLPAGCAAANDDWKAARAPGLPDAELRARLEAVVTACPAFAEGRTLLGKTLGRLGQDQAAVAQLRQALALDPGSAAARFGLAVVLLKGQQHAEALPLLDAVLAAEPAHPTARLARAQARLLAKDARGAVADLEHQVSIDPRSAPAWMLLGTARQAAGDLQGGAKALARGQELNRNAGSAPAR